MISVHFHALQHYVTIFFQNFVRFFSTRVYAMTLLCFRVRDKENTIHKYIKMKATITAAALSLGLAAAASAAATIAGISSISYTGTNPDSGITHLDDPNHLIDGSGLSAALTTANIDTVTHANPTFSAPGNAWATNDPNGGAGNDFFQSGGSQGSVVFEIVFDATYDVATFYNWSYDFDEGTANGNNIKTVTVDYGVGDFASSIGSVTLTDTANNVSSTGDFGGITADRVRLTVTDNFFGPGFNGGDRVSAAEFAFVTVPEPSSAALLGLGGLALALRRRK